MKLKALSLITGVFALSLAATPFAVLAEKTSPSTVAQGTEAPEKKGPWKELGLSEAQKTQIKNIKRDTRSKIDAVLTSEQKAKLKTEREARKGQPYKERGERPREPFASLNLTPDQRTKISTIKDSSKQQIDAVLTPEQREKFKKLREDKKARYQGIKQQ